MNEASPPSTTSPTPSLLWVVGTLLGLLVVLFGPFFLRLIDVWNTDPSYSHGYLIPLLSIWLAWQAYEQVGRPTEGDWGSGGAAILSGCLIHLVAIINWSLLLEYAALGLVLRGLALCGGGRTWASAFTFPILYLFFMIPLPGVWTIPIALWLQSVVGQVSTAVLDLVFVCQHHGNTIHIAGLSDPLVIAAECSGLRQIIAFVALGAFLGVLTPRPFWIRVLIVVAAIPVAILANVARVVLMAVVARYLGASILDGWMHHAPAAITIPVGVILYLLIVWFLSIPSLTNQSEVAP